MTAPPYPPECRSTDGPFDVDLEIRESAERRENRRLARCEHRRVGDDDCFAREKLPVVLDEVLEVVAADFLFAFGDEHDVHGKLAASLQMRFERFYVKEELPFVVD